jgi:hypothetical protein
MLSTTDFWNLIDLIDIKALDNEDEEQAIAPLKAALTNRTVNDLQQFEEHLAQVLFSIDGEAYFDAAGEAAGSDDSFLYVRCYVVAKGKDFFEMVRANPTKIPNDISQWCESLLYPHRIAWAEITGQDESEWPFETSVSFESGSNPELWPEKKSTTKEVKSWWRFW